jgi:hypothetical protein
VAGFLLPAYPARRMVTLWMGEKKPARRPVSF